MPKIAVVGTGQRFFKIYLPVLQELSRQNKVEIVGVFNRSKEPGIRAAQELQTHYYSDLSTLLDARPTLVLNLTKGPVKHEFSKKILKQGLHLWNETPASYSLVDIDELIRLSAPRNLLIQTAEDYAFTPEARRERELVKAGKLGRLQKVINNRTAFAYHATARLGQLLGDEAQIATCTFQKIRRPDITLDQWELTFTNGVTYLETMPNPKNHPSRAEGSWTVEGSLDSLVDKDKTTEAKQSAITHLLQNQLLAITSGGTLEYGIERSRRDLEWWLLKEKEARYFKLPSFIASLLKRLA